MSRMFPALTLLLLFSSLGCVWGQKSPAIRTTWVDFNIYGRPAMFFDRRSHEPALRQHTKHYLYQHPISTHVSAPQLSHAGSSWKSHEPGWPDGAIHHHAHPSELEPILNWDSQIPADDLRGSGQPIRPAPPVDDPSIIRPQIPSVPPVKEEASDTPFETAPPPLPAREASTSSRTKVSSASLLFTRP